jgi:hypothetical protein
MNFAELNRYFCPVTKNSAPNFEYLKFWDRKAPSWLDWSGLREFRRVVLLAEASSGKSAEFRNQADQLSAQGKSAFCLRIEELVDQGFEGVLDNKDSQSFKQWREANNRRLVLLRFR